MEDVQKKAPYRPTKLTDRFLEAADFVLNHDINAIIFTDEELLFLINKQLPDDEKVAERTFQDWKAGKSPTKDTERLDAFRALLKDALFRQKDELFKQFRNDKQLWVKWAWILERKFNDWNIRQKIEQDIKTDGKPIEIKVVSYKDAQEKSE